MLPNLGADAFPHYNHLTPALPSRGEVTHHEISLYCT